MSATKASSVLETLELDAAVIESLPEPVLSELIGFIEDGTRWRRRDAAALSYGQASEPAAGHRLADESAGLAAV
jgi:hypothetical protein